MTDKTCPGSKQPSGLEGRRHDCDGSCAPGVTGHVGAAHCPECNRAISITSTGKWKTHNRSR